MLSSVCPSSSTSGHCLGQNGSSWIFHTDPLQASVLALNERTPPVGHLLHSFRHVHGSHSRESTDRVRPRASEFDHPDRPFQKHSLLLHVPSSRSRRTPCESLDA